MSTTPDPKNLLRETLVFDWSKWDPGVAWRGLPAIAISLGAGIAFGHPAAGLVAAAGAFTTGLGSLHRICGSCVIPMLLAAVGMAFSTFVGMVVGHQSIVFVFIAGFWAAAYALLTVMRGGTSWVGLQWTVFLLVASAFHTTPGGALVRCSLVLAGGLLQTLIIAAIVRGPWGVSCAEPPEPEPGLRTRLGSLRQCATLRTPVCLYSLRMALVVMVSTEVFRHLNFLSGYWIPMTTLLVVRPDFFQTLTRGVMRVAGTVIGAGFAGLIAAHLHPSPAMLAAFVVFFAWWAYSVLNVNYALYTLALTAYIVFLLSLAGLPPATVVHRRAAYTLLGGVIALLAYIDVFVKTRRWIRAEGLTLFRRKRAA
ncbi:MAG: FUSC family protein [Acidobacteriaceae bacterium]